MEKPNITPWVAMPEMVYRERKGFYRCPIRVGIFTISYGQGVTEKEARDNAQAIVTAVNCTYGQNINPEKIQDLINIVEAMINPNMPAPTVSKVREALNNIKYKEQ